MKAASCHLLVKDVLKQRYLREMPLPPAPGSAQFPNQPEMQYVYPIMSMYGNAHTPQHQYAPGIPNQPTTPNLFMLMQLQMQLAQNGGMPAPVPQALPVQTQLNQSSDESRCSGNDTISPLQSMVQPAGIQWFPQNGIRTAVTPLANLNTTPIPVAVLESIRPQSSGTSPYAINNLLTTQAVAQNEKDDDKENSIARRNTYPTTSAPPSKRQRCHNSEMPIDVQSLPQLPQFPYAAPFSPFTPNFAANPYNLLSMSNMIRRDQNNRCNVCGDSSTGLHYGAQSCEGCKGFFRRTVSKNLKLVCAKGEEKCAFVQNCANDHRFRTRCPACRFKQCLNIGMNQSHVRMSKEKEKEKESTSNTNPVIPPNLDQSPEVSELVSSFVACMGRSTHLTSGTHAIELVKKFIRNVPSLSLLFPEDLNEFNAMIQRFMDGLLAIRAAFTYDSVAFNASQKFTSKIEMLRQGLRNTVFSDTEVALLSAIHILLTINGSVGEILTSYCQGLREEISLTHNEESGLYDRLIMRLGPSINQ